MESNIGEIIKSSLENIKEIAGVSTIIGDEIRTPDGTVIIPVSKVSLGFASGGIDFNSKEHPKEKNGTVNGSINGKNTNPKNFGGGGGTGVTISPIGFLVIKSDGEVEFLNIACTEKPNNIIDSITSIFEKSPEIIQKFKSVFNKEKETEEDIFGDDSKEKTGTAKTK
jgi:sporulation protein YtfJ